MTEWDKNAYRQWLEAMGGELLDPVETTEMKKLITQATAMPTRKIKATGIAGALTAAVMGALHWWQPEIAGMVAGPVEAGIVAVVAFVAGYFTRDEADD